MKRTLIVLSLGLLSGSALESANVFATVGPFEEISLSESMILNSSAFNLHSAIQEGLLDRESPEYLLIS